MGYRIIGTVVGELLAILVVHHWSVTPLSAGVVMGGMVLLCGGLGLRHSTRLAALVFAVGITEFASEVDTWAGGRIVATLVGAAVSIVVSAVPMPFAMLRLRHDYESDVPRGFIVGQE